MIGWTTSWRWRSCSSRREELSGKGELWSHRSASFPLFLPICMASIHTDWLFMRTISRQPSKRPSRRWHPSHEEAEAHVGRLVSWRRRSCKFMMRRRWRSPRLLLSFSAKKRVEHDVAGLSGGLTRDICHSLIDVGHLVGHSRWSRGPRRTLSKQLSLKQAKKRCIVKIVREHGGDVQ